MRKTLYTRPKSEERVVIVGRWDVVILERTMETAVVVVYSYCMHSYYSMTGPNTPSASGRAG